MVSHAQRRDQRRRAEARFAGRLCKLVEQRHRGFVLARALLRAAAGCPQDVSTQTEYFAPALDAHAAPAPVAPVLSDLQEPPVPIVKVVQIPQVQLID